ncbi:MAG: riboflavin synthase [Persicimonas sp.]
MFTGLVSDIGTIARLTQSGSDWKVSIDTAFDLDDVELGESIAVDGACLTVTEIGAGTFGVEASPETLARTTLGERKVGDSVHLERALRVGDRLGGHMVLGHVDAVGELVAKQRAKNAWVLEFDAPDAVARYLIGKGSVTIDGVSLTVNSVDGARFSVAIIPHTAQHTHLTEHGPGHRVNLEADVIGKYVEKFVAPHKDSGITKKMLDDMGF